MSGLAGYNTVDQGAAYIGVDSSVLGGNDRSAIQSDRTLVTATSGNVAAATASASLPAVSGKTNVCTSVSFVYSGATAASMTFGTVSAASPGIVGGSIGFPVVVPLGATVAAQPIVIQFEPPLVAAGTNLAIVATVPTLGTGALTAAITINGYLVP